MDPRVRPADDVGDVAARCPTTSLPGLLPCHVVAGLDPATHLASSEDQADCPRPIKIATTFAIGWGCEDRWIRGSGPRMTSGMWRRVARPRRCRTCCPAMSLPDLIRQPISPHRKTSPIVATDPDCNDLCDQMVL